MICKCGKDLTGLPVKDGVGKASGKPYRAIICPNCKTFNFLNTPKPKVEARPELTAKNELAEILMVVNKIWEKMNTPKSTKWEEEE